MSIRFKKTPLQKRLSGRAPFAPAEPAPERPPLPATGADKPDNLSCPKCGGVVVRREERLRCLQCGMTARAMDMGGHHVACDFGTEDEQMDAMLEDCETDA